MDSSRWNQLAVICGLVEEASGLKIGRTAMMKFLYLLKELKGVPLDYRFTLYTYGPFDSRVLDDLSYAGALEAVESELIAYPGGYGYVFSPGPKVEDVTSRGKDFLNQHRELIEWVVREFGGRSASDLEMISTIVFVDREAVKHGKDLTLENLASKVIEVKPHLSIENVRREAEELREKSYISAIAS